MKRVLTFIMVLIMTFISMGGFAQSLSEKTLLNRKQTPIANIKNDNYVSYTNYSSESVDLNFSTDFEPIAQVITVMTTPTGSTVNGNYKKSMPIRDALVRIDGIPMYTNFKGQIDVTLTREYVELQVTKDEYNPYIEIIEATGEEKVVYLKKPTDDIEIYSVMFQYGVKFFNLITQPCHYLQNQGVNIGLLTVNSNIEYDLILFYVNDELSRVGFQDGIIFTNEELDKFSPNDKFSLKIVYEDIESSRVDLLLKVEKFDVNKLKSDMIASTIDSGDNEFGMNNDSSGVGNIGDIQIDKKKWLSGMLSLTLPERPEFLNVSTPLFGPSSLEIHFSIDPYKGTITCMGGVSVDLKRLSENMGDLIKAMHDKSKTYKDIKEEKLNKIEEKIIKAQNEQEKIESDIEKLSQNTEKNKDQLNAANAELEKVKKLREEGKAWTKQDGYRTFQDESKKFITSVEGLAREQEKTQNAYDKIVSEYKNAEKMANKSGKKNQQQIFDLMKESLLNQDGIDKKIAKIPELFRNNVNGGGFDFDVELSLLAVVEYSYRNCELVEFSIMAEIELQPSYTYRYLLYTPVCVVPLFIKITGLFGVSARVTLWQETQPIPFFEAFNKIEFAITLGLRVDGGVGIPGVATAGVFGEVKFKYKFSPVPEEWSFRWRAGVLLTLLGYKIEFGYESQEIELSPKSTCADNAKLSPMKRAMETSSNISDNQVFDRVYDSSRPQLIQLSDNKQMLFWIEDDMNRDSYNRSVLKYAVSNNGVWGQAKSVFDNGRADHAYDIYITNDSVLIGLQKSQDIINENNTIDDVAKGCEIYALEYSKATNSFGTANKITNNDVYDTLPQFAVSKGNPTLLWQSSSDTDFMSFSGRTTIHGSSFDGNSWNAMSDCYKTDSIIYSYTASVESNTLTLVVSEDADNDFLTQDIKTTVVKDSNRFVLDKIAQNPKFIEIDNSIALIYYNGKDLVITNDYIDEETIVNNISSKEYNISKSTQVPTIFYEGFNGVAEQGYCAVYGEKGWTENISVVVEGNDNSDISGLTGYYDNGSIYSTYNYCLIDESSPSYGQLVACVAKKDFGYGIKTKAYSLTGIKHNALARIMLNIENKGDFDVSKFTVLICEQEFVFNLGKPLKVGENRFFEIEFTAIIGTEDYFVVRTSIFADNNLVVTTDECQLQAKYTDMKVDISRSVQNGKQEFIVNIENISQLASGYNVTIYINGQPYKEYTGFLNSGDKIEYVMLLDEVAEMDYIYFKIVADMPEFNTSDNSMGYYSLQTEKIVSNNLNNKYHDKLQNIKNFGV